MQLSAVGWLLFSCAFFAASSSSQPRCFNTNWDKCENPPWECELHQHRLEHHKAAAAEGRFMKPPPLVYAAAPKNLDFRADNLETRSEQFRLHEGNKCPSRGSESLQYCEPPSKIVCNEQNEYRTFDGTCNNLETPRFGSVNSCHQRVLGPNYDDGASSPRTKKDTLPNPRDVCLALHRSPRSDCNIPDLNLTTLFMSFGQFVDHDIALTAVEMDGPTPVECCPLTEEKRKLCFPITLSGNDPDFPGRTCMDLPRSSACKQCEPRQQYNFLTSFLDGSHIYGNSEEIAKSVRKSDGSGKLETQLINDVGELLPAGEGKCGNNNCFKTADPYRANQNTPLTLLHTVFVLFHNEVVTSLKSFYSHWDGEKLYQEARRFVVACLQRIFYDFHLPLLVGRDECSSSLYQMDTSYNCKQNPATINEVMTAAFRLHTLVPDYFLCITENKCEKIPLKQHFFNVNPFYNPGGLKCVARGSFAQPEQRFDPYVARSVGQYLFTMSKEAPPSLDLCTINIQRGRDHGITGYTEYVKFCFDGRETSSFADLQDLLSADCLESYKCLYSSVHDIDLWSALQCELRCPHSLLGPVSRCLVRMQFNATKYGDRYFWTHVGERGSLSASQRIAVSEMTLERIMCDVLKFEKIPYNVFRFTSPILKCDDPRIPKMDLSAWGA